MKILKSFLCLGILVFVLTSCEKENLTQDSTPTPNVQEETSELAGRNLGHRGWVYTSILIYQPDGSRTRGKINVTCYNWHQWNWIRERSLSLNGAQITQLVRDSNNCALIGRYDDTYKRWFSPDYRTEVVWW